MICEIETETSTYYVEANDMAGAVSQVTSLCEVAEATIRTVQHIETLSELFNEVEAEEVVDNLEEARGQSSISEGWYNHLTQMEDRIEDDDETLYSIYDDIKFSITAGGIYRKVTDTVYKTI